MNKIEELFIIEKYKFFLHRNVGQRIHLTCLNRGRNHLLHFLLPVFNDYPASKEQKIIIGKYSQHNQFHSFTVAKPLLHLRHPFLYGRELLHWREKMAKSKSLHALFQSIEFPFMLISKSNNHLESISNHKRIDWNYKLAYMMNKISLFLIIFFIVCLSNLCRLNATTLRVALNGNQLYNTIQSAINASTNNDTILVYPGTYYENIVIDGKSITLSSLELITGNINYKYSTIIDGNMNGAVVYIKGLIQTEITIRGFTIQYGNGRLLSQGGSCGGGISISPNQGPGINVPNIKVINCIIQENTASSFGGGISHGSSILYLSGTTIKNNKSECGGGIYHLNQGPLQSFDLIFDPVNRCNIYNNWGSFGADIYSYWDNSVNVIVDTFTVANPWNFYANGIALSSSIVNPYTFNILHTVHTETNHDLYVAPWGNDHNNGLSSAEPLKTIYLAIHKIASDPENPKTVHLAPGIYSPRDGQFFPIALKQNMILQGEDMNSVIFDCESHYKAITVNPHTDYSLIKNITIIRSSRSIMSILANYLTCENILIKENEEYSMLSSIFTFKNQNTFLKNIKITDIVSTNAAHPQIYSNKNKVIIDNLLVNNCITTEGKPSFIMDGKGFFSINNSKFINNISGAVNDDGINSMGQIGPYPDASSIDYLKIRLNNCVWTGNSQRYQSGPMAHFSSVNDTLFITNCTFADNIGGTETINVTGNTVLTNNIFWNPRLQKEIGIPYFSDYNPFQVKLSYNNIRNGINGLWNDSSLNTIIYEPTNTSFVPQFAGSGSHPYRLSALSPLIDNGTPDTTGLSLPFYDVTCNERLWDGNYDEITRIDIGAYEYQPMNSPEYLSVRIGLNKVFLNWLMTENFLLNNSEKKNLNYPFKHIGKRFNRSLSGYRVYRNNVVIADINNPEITSYIDQITITDTLSYYIVALYGELESEPSNIVTIYVEYVPNQDETVSTFPSLIVYPNPFSTNTNISFTLKESSEVRLEVYGIKGQKLRGLISQKMSKGSHNCSWDGKDDNGNFVGRGIFFIRLHIGKRHLMCKTVFL